MGDFGRYIGRAIEEVYWEGYKGRFFFFYHQAIPVNSIHGAASGDEAQAAKKRRCLPTGSHPTPARKTPAKAKHTPARVSAAAQDPVSGPAQAPAPERDSITALSPIPTPPNTTPKDTTVTPMDTTTATGSAQMDTTPHMDSSTFTDALTESALVLDPTLIPESTLFESTLNSDPLLSALSPPLPSQYMSDSYTPSNGYVSYMETLLNSHFPQDDGPGPLY